jgi:hypothetical protein
MDENRHCAAIVDRLRQQQPERRPLRRRRVRRGHLGEDPRRELGFVDVVGKFVGIDVEDERIVFDGDVAPLAQRLVPRLHEQRAAQAGEIDLDGEQVPAQAEPFQQVGREVGRVEATLAKRDFDRSGNRRRRRGEGEEAGERAQRRREKRRLQHPRSSCDIRVE